MANLKPLKRDIKAIMPALNADYDSTEDAAEAILARAWDIYEDKAKFIVVGQLRYSPKGGWITKDDADVTKVAMGPYTTLKQAESAMDSLTLSAQTGETFRTWAIEYWHSTPFLWFKERKAQNEAWLEDLDPGADKTRERILKEHVAAVNRLIDQVGVTEFGDQYRKEHGRAE